MDQVIAKTGSAVVTVTVALFAVCMLIPFHLGSYFVCMLLPIGYIMMTAGFCSECDENHRAAAYAGMTFAAVYAVLILLVYFAQTTKSHADIPSTGVILILGKRVSSILAAGGKPTWLRGASESGFSRQIGFEE